VDLHSLKINYLDGHRDSELLKTIRSYDRKIDQCAKEDLLSKIMRHLEYPRFFMKQLATYHEQLSLQGLQFTCNSCGRCCETLRIGVTIEDIRTLIDKNKVEILSTLTLDWVRPSFRLITKHEFHLVEMIISPHLRKVFIKINPSLDDKDMKTGSHCMFHDSRASTSKCSIYKYRPLECRIYPLGNVLLGMQNPLCDKECFIHGNPVDINNLDEELKMKKVSDIAHHSLYTLNPFSGWRERTYKLTLLFDHLLKIL
jgi:Fe-S-cluster containining protein